MDQASKHCEGFKSLIPPGRIQRAEDVDDAVVEFPVSNASKYLVGTAITREGGCVVRTASVNK